MSTETKTLKLMPHTLRKGAGGRVFIEPGARDEFELPPAFYELFAVLEAGSSLSKLVDHIDTTKSNARFRLVKKFLLFLDEQDMLADRDYVRLAESLKPEYTWPTSIMQTELAEIPLLKAAKMRGSAIGLWIIFVVTLFLATLSLLMFILTFYKHGDDTALHSLVLYVATFSISRSVQALWSGMTSWVSGIRPSFDFVAELSSVRVRQEQKGRALPKLLILSNFISLLLILGVASVAYRSAGTDFEKSVVQCAGFFAFMSEASPFSRSSLTDLIRSLFGRFDERASASPIYINIFKKIHVTACVLWVGTLGFYVSISTGSLLREVTSKLAVRDVSAKWALIILLILVVLQIISWIADIIGAVSYDGASIADIRRLWRRKKESPLQSLSGLPPSAQDLERLPFLRQIPAEVRKSLLLAAQVRSFKEGQAICHQNDRDRNLFVVLEGRLAVARTATNVSASRRKVVAWLDPGAVFGENAFFFGQPRSADVIGMDAGRVLVLPHTKEMSVVEGEKSEQLRTRIWFLQALVQSQFFKELPADSLDSILLAGVEQRFSAGAKIIQEGEQADACYFIVQGRATVTQKTKALAKLNAGDAFGEIAILFPGTLRTATIVADTDLITIRIDREKFWKLLKAHLPLALEIERLGLRRLRQDQQRA